MEVKFVTRCAEIIFIRSYSRVSHKSSTCMFSSLFFQIFWLLYCTDCSHILWEYIKCLSQITRSDDVVNPPKNVLNSFISAVVAVMIFTRNPGWVTLNGTELLCQDMPGIYGISSLKFSFVPLSNTYWLLYNKELILCTLFCERLYFFQPERNRMLLHYWYFIPIKRNDFPIIFRLHNKIILMKKIDVVSKIQEVQTETITEMQRKYFKIL